MITQENEVSRFFATMGLNLKIHKPNKFYNGVLHSTKHRLELVPGKIGLDRFMPLLSYYFDGVDVWKHGGAYVLLSTFNPEGHGDTGVCKLCGCTETNACTGQQTPTGTCYWVEGDLCSACITDLEKAKYTALEIIERARKFKEAFGGAFGKK